MRKTNHSYRSNKSKRIDKGSMYEPAHNGAEQIEDAQDLGEEIEQSPNENEEDEEDIFIGDPKKKALTPTGGSLNNLRDQENHKKKKG